MTETTVATRLHSPHPAHLCQNPNYTKTTSCNGFCHNAATVTTPDGLRICAVHAKIAGLTES